MLHDVLHSLAPVMWTGIAITAIVLRHRRKMASIRHDDPRPATAADAEIAQLHERIRVLERIATSSSLEGRSAERLSAEIEALRHP